MENELLLKLGVELTELAIKGTVGKINTKIALAKENKNMEAAKTQYEEIINELLSERENAIRIAQMYKTELERLEISDSDIEHLHNTIDKFLNIMKKFSPDKDIGGIESLKEIINVDTLKAMQLLGFNYKKAIGEPLTTVCAEKIKEIGLRNPNRK